MSEEKQDGQGSIKDEILYTPGGYEATLMVDPETEMPLVIRESFERRRLTEDNETEAEHKMRKKLLNKFKKMTEKNRGRIIHRSVSYEPQEDGTFKRVGNTYKKPKK